MTLSSPMPWRFVSALSITQLVSYGTLFYAFALFIEPMERELGWSKAELTAAYSLSLVSSAFFAVPVGRLIDEGRGRMVMTGGSILAALLLALWSWTQSYAVFVLIWIGLGAAMSAVLYEAGFAVLALNLGLLTRRGITVMTLVGGFASTVFIPLTHWLIELYGWRGTLLALAGFNLVICALLHAWSIPPVAGALHREDRPQPAAKAKAVLATATFWCFVATSVLQGMIAAGLPIHLIPLLLEKGLSLEAAVAAFSLIGPAQVAARLATGFGERALGMKAVGVLTQLLGVLAFAGHLLRALAGGGVCGRLRGVERHDDHRSGPAPTRVVWP
jgi:MFS family permease